MLAYILRRLMLVIPTLLGIMVINFFIIQAAPGGPVEQMLAQIQGTAVSATERFSGSASGGETVRAGPMCRAAARAPIAARAACPRN